MSNFDTTSNVLPDPTSAFARLLKDFASQSGQEDADTSGAWGIEFSSGQLVVRIVPHPFDPDSLSIDIDVLLLNLNEPESDYRLLLLLHKLNDITRFTTGWTTVITEDNMLTLARCVPIESTTPQVLARLVLEGLDLAAPLAEGWDSIFDLFENARQAKSEAETSSESHLRP